MTQPTVLHAIRAGATGLLLASHALATTWVVDDNGGPGVDFVNVQDAIDAAVDGDVIEVRDGTYPGFTVDGKALVVRGTGPSVRVFATVLVTGVDATRRVELDHLLIGAFGGPGATSAVVTNSPGSVRLVDCFLLGKEAESDSSYPQCVAPAEHALRVDGSDAVTLLRCLVYGGTGYYSYYCGWDGGVGLVATQSVITALDCTFNGGTGGWGSGNLGGDGGDGAFLDVGSALLVHRSDFDGASGGPGAPPGTSGSGVVLENGSTLAWKDSTFDSIVGPAQEVAIAPYCLGTFEECPCGNNGAGTAGCEHSFGTGGARLAGVGNASVAADTVTLQITGLNPNASPTALFFQGTTGSEGILFNDGLLCAGGTIRRMKGKLAQNGAVSFGFGQPGDPLVSAAGNVPPAGATRYYQVWYRNNSASFCTPQRFNMSNGVEIAWAP